MNASNMSIVELYQFLNYELMDPRNRDVFYISSPWFVVAILSLYLYFVLSLGPKIMEKRPPFQLEGLIRIYNIAQIAANSYMFYKGSSVLLDEKYNLQCMPVLYDTGEYSMRINLLVDHFFWLKISDLLDTVFFVLRKKNSQVSFLHVYHHSMMVLGVWIAIKYLPGGNPLMLGFINAFVHIVMYSYYLISSIDPNYKKSLWWKKHLTQLQILQFFLISVHMGQLLIYNPCGYPHAVVVLLCTNLSLITLLFIDFYRKAYGKQKSS